MSCPKVGILYSSCCDRWLKRDEGFITMIRTEQPWPRLNGWYFLLGVAFIIRQIAWYRRHPNHKYVQSHECDSAEQLGIENHFNYLYKEIQSTVDLTTKSLWLYQGQTSMRFISRQDRNLNTGLPMMPDAHGWWFFASKHCRGEGYPEKRLCTHPCHRSSGYCEKHKMKPMAFNDEPQWWYFPYLWTRISLSYWTGKERLWCRFFKTLVWTRLSDSGHQRYWYYVIWRDKADLVGTNPSIKVSKHFKQIDVVQKWWGHKVLHRWDGSLGRYTLSNLQKRPSIWCTLADKNADYFGQILKSGRKALTEAPTDLDHHTPESLALRQLKKAWKG